MLLNDIPVYKCMSINVTYTSKQHQHLHCGCSCDFQLVYWGRTAEQSQILYSLHHPDKWILSQLQRKHCHMLLLLHFVGIRPRIAIKVIPKVSHMFTNLWMSNLADHTQHWHR